jgi:hypothetical protein
MRRKIHTEKKDGWIVSAARSLEMGLCASGVGFAERVSVSGFGEPERAKAFEA